MLLLTNNSIAQSACTTSPPCPGAANKKIYSYYDAGTNANYWQETTALFSSGEKLTIHSPFSTSISLATTSMFYNEYNFRCDGNRIGQLTTGNYNFGLNNRFNYIGDDIESSNFPNASRPRITGFHNFYNNINATFGTYNSDQLHSTEVNPSIYWHQQGNDGSASRLMFLFKENNFPEQELATLRSNGNFGINSTVPLSKLEVKGGLMVTDQVTGITAPNGFIYASGGIHLGSESFINSVKGNTFIATYPGTKTALGLNNPAAYLHLHALTTSATNHFKITTDISGEGASDGLSIDMNGNNVDVINHEDGSIRFSTSGQQRFRIENNGDLIPNNNGMYNIGSSLLSLNEIFATNQSIQASDIKKKKKITKLYYGISELIKLEPVSYHWTLNDNGMRIGLIAQDVEKVIPEIVVKETDTIGIEHFGLRYVEIIPILINAIKQQQYQISELTNKIEKLEINSKDISKNNSLNGYLINNIPNPFKNQTTIYFYLPSNSKNNKLIITDVQKFNVKLEFDILEPDKGFINIDCSSLSNGIYIYSLYSSGELLDSKKFIVE